ncbi:MAG TPA: MerR family transcriptional regulator [Candidatus Marinimicrobia bacterium]|jgi:DNA-binding transcriptional MerR regulator|nr:MerR family transcriptional regulator [Candidatus Neomarinimicrobiota bacterium]MDP7512258.1 MerR family transcriptional regulator [Candidatus Neomarinimicrobiota bacterium]HBR86252.1 MerR family transcriptional regulator [Candidatus Neomarinimicrobiota bacterium]HJM12385.1 MerR family transcriptional regulator [Candidatus Neomarinimicrobiota bacterium]|tara:strand:- start:4001 stop:4372 length:372 start_codon:yes stop_codon:yes gene_type:complete
MGSAPKQIKKLYYSIGEVSKLTELKPYVLRYWETEFKQLAPPKNRAGNRTYRQKDIDIILQIKDLLYNRKFTIKGAITQFSSGEKAKEMVGQQETAISDENNSEILVKVKQELESILDFIHKN